MDATLHTIIAVGCLMISFYAGRFFATRGLLEKIVCLMLDRLEFEGYIITEKDEDGEKELIPVSELIAKALREAKKI